jgi:iron(III) transport system substrate-binding protein
LTATRPVETIAREEDDMRHAWYLLLLACLLPVGCKRAEDRVVLYCAQDRDFAVDVLAAFQADKGLSVTPKFDTEANKSVGLYREIVAERARPRCDVFWNNEIVSTIRLSQQGLLQPYQSPAAEPYPAWAKAEDGTCHAFAARARVLIVNTKLVAEQDRPLSLLDLAEPRFNGLVVMARPQFGTTATQAACLWEVLGPRRARQFYRGLKANAVRLAPGNKQVAEWVAQGRTPSGQTAAIGMTDTDDAIGEVKAGRDVVIVYPDAEAPRESRLGTLFIPNTLSIPRGCPNPAGARKLVDYLLSAEVEAKLAEGEGQQVPLNPNVKANLHPAIAAGRKARPMRVDWVKAAAAWDEAQEFLDEEFTAP